MWWCERRNVQKNYFKFKLPRSFLGGDLKRHFLFQTSYIYHNLMTKESILLHPCIVYKQVTWSKKKDDNKCCSFLKVYQSVAACVFSSLIVASEWLSLSGLDSRWVVVFQLLLLLAHQEWSESWFHPVLVFSTEKRILYLYQIKMTYPFVGSSDSDK